MIELTNMILIRKDDKFLFLNRRRSTWPGITFPGGHVEENESIVDSVLREAYEETGLKISNPKLVDIIEWNTNTHRELSFLYETDEFEGDLKPSFEGEVFFARLDEINKENYSNDFDKILKKYKLI